MAGDADDCMDAVPFFREALTGSLRSRDHSGTPKLACLRLAVAMACTVVADRLGKRGAVQFPVRRVERVQLGSAVVAGGTGSHPSSKWGANPIA